MKTTTRNPITGRAAICIHHANAKGTGSAVCLTPIPTTPENDGALVVAVAPQNGPAVQGEPLGVPAVLPFDWTQAVRVRLDPLEAAELLAVFGGSTSILEHDGTEGIAHDCPEKTCGLGLRRSEDPSRPGFLLTAWQIPKADPTARSFRSIALRPAEALLLRHALAGVLPRICFGE